MDKIIINFVLGVLLLSFNGCSGNLQVLKNDKIDNLNRTIYVPGNSSFYTYLRQKLQKNNWNVTTQYGFSNSKGSIDGNNNININHSTAYSTRYSLACRYYTFWDFGTKYAVDCTLFDNTKGIDVVNISNRHSDFEQFNLDEITSVITKAINE